MADNTPSSPFKTKLAKTETSRLKTETSRQRKTAGDSAADKTIAFTPPPAPPPPTTEPGSTAPIADPMARRDTSTGKLHRVQSPDETANALAPVVGAEPKRTETVRLKVVRNTRSELQNVVPEGQPSAASPRPAGDTLAVPPPPAVSPDAATRQGTPALKVQSSAVAAATPVPETKRSTSTLKVQAPAAPPADGRRAAATIKVERSEEPAETIAEAAAPAAPTAQTPDQTQATQAFNDTGTSTIKLQVRKPSRPPSATGPAPATGGKVATTTLKIRPPSAAGTGAVTAAGTAPGATPGSRPPPNKEATATLKIQMPTEAAAPSAASPGATAVPTDAAKDVTAMLKVRPGGAGAKPAPAPEPEAGTTVKIRPPALMMTKPPARVAPEDETQVGVQTLPVAAPPAAAEKPKVSLKLRKGDEAKPIKRDVTIPGLGEKQVPPPAEEGDSAATIAVTPALPAEPKVAEAGADEAAAATVVLTPADQTVAIGKKKGLRIKTGKAKEEVTAAGEAVAAQVQEQEGGAAAPLAAGEAAPGRLAAAAALLAFAGAAALLVRLLLDLKWRYM